ncbi:SDR family oxidoreductase [Nonomuraea sp. NPDC049419]|uniref:SDR family NAD(P)-dependent oxidoreductase n=1 Tax=Nonomuraea sp. NPDC049419 TaxID=3155772 RepID=UPI00342335CA
MLLKDKIAVVYGGGGSVAGAIARAFAREGAVVHLAGRTMAALQAVAEDITAGGGQAHPAVVDALDESQVDAHAAAVIERSGALDISVNVIADQDVQGTPMVEMSVEDYLRPVEVAVRSKFLTARAAARQMI